MSKHRGCTIALCLLVAALCRGQRVITTFAGSDFTYPASPFSPNAASFGELISAAVSPSGDVYFVSETRSIVLKFSPAANTVSIVAGIGIGGYSGDGGPAARAELNNPQGIAFDSDGNLYIADNENNVIRKVDKQGTITTFASAPFVVGVTVAADGTLYFSNYFEVVHINSNGTFTVVAGGKQPGYGGDNGPATAALVANVSGLVFDHAGNLLIADSANYRIRKIDTKGIITTLAGNGQGGSAVAGPATSSPITYPVGVALDASGNIYTGDYTLQLLKIDTAGQLSIVNSNASTFFVTAPGPVSKAELNPYWPALDAAGNIYVADYAGYLWKISTGGTIQVAAGYAPTFDLGDNGPAVLSGLNAPAGIALMADGSLLIAEQYNDRIRRVSPKGTITTAVGNGAVGFTSAGPAATVSLYLSSAVAADSSGNIFVVSNGAVYKVNPAGSLSLFYQGSSGATSIATDSQGNLLVTTSGNQIVKVAPNGTATVIAGTGQGTYGGDGGLATMAALNAPMGVAADSAGNIYVADTNNYRIRKISPAGTITTIGGGGATEIDGVPATQSAVIAPQSIACDNSGNVYFVELVMARVREISSTGTISTIAGTGVAGFSGDGGPATSAQLNEPWGIAADQSGNVFVADRLNNRIREVLTARPSITVSSNQVSISALSSGVPAQSNNITVSSSTPGVAYSLSFSTTSGDNWLNASLTQGQAPGVFSINADPTNLKPATYQGTITLTSPYATPQTQSIAVTFQVASGVPPKLAVGNGPLNFPLSLGNGPATAQLNVTNQGGGTLSFNAQVSANTPWLQVSPSTGTATPAAAVPLTVTVTPGALGTGTYSGIITVTSATTGESIPVSVTLAISGANQNMVLSQTGLTFTAVEQGGSLLPQSFSILNTGQGSMTWSATATPLSGGSWLSIDQSSGTVATPLTGASPINVSVNASGLSAGTYYGQIVVTAPGAPNSPQSISVIFNVLPAGSNPGAEVRPTGLIFIGQAGSSPGSQTVMISNPAAGEVTFDGSFFTVPTGGTWARFLPTNGAVEPNAPLSMVVQPDYTNLTPGVYPGFVSLGFADGTSRSVQVLAVVSAAGQPGTNGAAQFTLGAQASGSCSPIRVQPTSLTSPDSSVTIGTAVSLQVRAVDNCGNLITSSNGAVGATFNNGDSSVTMVHEGNGNWSGTWTPQHGGSAQVQITYKAFEGSGVSLLSGTANLTVALQPANGTPVTAGAGNAASGLGAFISPGGLISIYGQQLASQAVTSGSTPFPTNVNGTQVLLGGLSLPLRFVSEQQINAQVPFELGTNGINAEQQLIVQNGNTLSVPRGLVLAASQPGIYTQDQSGSGPGVIVDFNTGKEVTPDHPANIGDTLTIYCNGLGAVNPPVATGMLAPSVEPFARTATPVTVTIGNVNAQVEFAGLAPGFPDLYQVNAIVPLGVQPGSATPIVVSVANQSSPPVVTIAIQ